MAYRPFGRAAQSGPVQLDLFAPIERSEPVRVTAAVPEPATAAFFRDSYGRDHPMRVGTEPVTDLLPPGTVVEMSYGTGPYIVVEVVPYERGFHLSMSGEAAFLAKRTKGSLKPEHYIGDVVAVEGRLLKAFASQEHEVFIRRFNAEAAALLEAA